MRQTLCSGCARRDLAVANRAELAQLLLIAGLAVTVGLSGGGLSPAGWAVGLTCGVITNAALASGASHYRADRLTRADWVTLARATLAVGVAALVADSFGQTAPVATAGGTRGARARARRGRRVGRATHEDDRDARARSSTARSTRS